MLQDFWSSSTFADFVVGFHRILLAALVLPPHRESQQHSWCALIRDLEVNVSHSEMTWNDKASFFDRHANFLILANAFPSLVDLGFSAASLRRAGRVLLFLPRRVCGSACCFDEVGFHVFWLRFRLSHRFFVRIFRVVFQAWFSGCIFRVVLYAWIQTQQIHVLIFLKRRGNGRIYCKRLCSLPETFLCRDFHRILTELL